MQKLAEICIRRPVFASMIVLTLVVVGAASYMHLGVDRFPSVDLPTVRVSTRLPGASPAEMEAQISQPMEEAINTIEGIKELRSVNGSGISYIIVTFELNRDIDAAAQDVRDRVATVLRNLPRDADPPTISKSDNDQSPVLSLALSGQRSQRELTEIADKIVKTQIERSPGVGEVQIIGGLERAINVWVDADRLAAYQIPITSVRDAVERQNANTAGGNVTTDLREQTLRTMGRLTNPKAFNDLVVVTRGGLPIRVRDIGWAPAPPPPPPAPPPLPPAPPPLPPPAPSAPPPPAPPSEPAGGLPQASISSAAQVAAAASRAAPARVPLGVKVGERRVGSVADRGSSACKPRLDVVALSGTVSQ